MKATVRLALIALSTAAYLGLAILGWGGSAAFFSHPPLVALAIVLFALAGVSLFAGGNLSSGVREDRGNRWVLAAFGWSECWPVSCPRTRTAAAPRA